jgi:hypothetical protein
MAISPLREPEIQREMGAYSQDFCRRRSGFLSSSCLTSGNSQDKLSMEDIGIAADVFLQGGHRLLIPPAQVIGLAQLVQVPVWIRDTDTHRLLRPSDGFFRSSCKAQTLGQYRVALTIVRSEGNGPLGLGQSLFRLLLPQIDFAQCDVGPSLRVIQGDGLLCRFKPLL